MAHRLVRVRAVSVGVTALLLFQSANQLPNAVAATASPLSGEATVLGREDQPTEVGAVPVLQRPGGGSGIGVGGVGADVQPRPVFPPYHPPSQPTDVPGLRDAHQDVTANPDGTYTATVSQAKINYLDNFGLWQPIDRRLIASTDATYDLKIAANNVELLVSDAHGSSGAAALSSGDLVVKLRLPGYGAATAASPTTTPSASAEPSDSPSSPPSLGPSDAPSTSGPVQDVTPTLVPAPSDPTASPAASTAPDPSADGSESAAPSAAPSNTPDPTSTPIPSASGVAASAPIESPTPPPQRGPDITSISFPGASGRPDATVGSTDEGFEFGAIFRGPTDPPVFNAVIDLGGLSATLAPDGQTVVLTETTTGDGQSAVTTTVGRISIPGLHDADGAGATGADLSVTIVESGSTSLPDGVGPDLVAGLAPTEVILSYAIAPSYLADPLRIYPVTLDPTVCIANSVSGCTSGAFDHFIGSGIATTYPTGWTTFRVGYESRGLGYGTLRGLLYFPDVALPDGAEVTDADLHLHISSEYGSPSGEAMHVDRVTRGWSQTSTWNNMTIPTSGWTGTGASPDVTVPSSGYMDFHPTGIVQQWYTRRGQSWSPDFGLMIKMNSEGSTHGEVEFDRYNDASDSFHPKLTITYVEPRVQIDFDPTLGATYAPSSMVIGQTAKLPIQVRNNASGYTFNHCLSGTTTDCYQIGYRWFDAKGALVSSNQQDFTADLTTGSLSVLFALAVTPPGTAAAQDTLRLDLVHRIGGSAGTYLWASDWALPSRYYSRNKKVLTTDSTRWVGSSRIERDEFGITFVTGAGSSQGEVQTVSLGDGGGAGINLWSGDLQYTGSGGVGFKDLATVGLSYGYDSANVADCTGILAACGWYTNYDERLTPTATVGDYTYQGPSGNRYYVGRDGDGQLTSAAPILLERPRVTFFDETGPSSGATALWTTAQHYTGAGSLAAANNVIIDSGVPVPVQPHLQDYPLLRFAIKTSAAGASMAGIRFKIHDLTDTSKTDVWLVYTVGNTSHTWSTGLAQIDLTDAFTPGGGWTETASRNLFGDARTAIGAATYDDLTVLNFQIEGNTGLPAGNTTWVDSVRLEPQRFVYTSNGQSAWTAHGQAGTSTDHPSDPLITLTTSAAITPTTIPASPDCVGCTGGGGALGLLPFVSWSWKKVGGTSIATILHLKDLRLGSGGPGAYLTGDLTYYAGRVAPPGAANPIQVSDTVPTDWTLVRRNVLEDARQVLNFFDDQDTTGTSTSPSGAPTPDDVLWTGWRFAVVDGNFGLWNVLAYDSQPRLGEKAGQSMADDYMATYGGGAERHYFNRDGLLTQIVTRNGDTTTLDWTFSHGAGASGQSAYTLTAIHAPTDATSSGGATLDRQIDVSRSGSSPIITTFAETLGSTVSHVSAPRQTVFSVATATGTGIGIGDVISIVPARAGTSACAGTAPIGCAKYTYSSTTSHLLSRIGDPRWDGTTSGTASDLTFGVTYDGSKRATSITDNSKSAAPLARVVSFDTGTSVGYRRALWQNADALAAGYGIHSDLSPDGALAVDHVPQVCTSGDCVAHPPANDDPTLNALISQASALDGLGRVSTSTTYRVSGGTPQLVVSRQATKAGAKVDNFDDPLVANELAWTQSPDEYVASLQDSGRTDPDLYRTTYAYNALGQTTDTITPIENGKTGYAATVTETTNGTAIGPKDYYRLDEASCANPAADSGTAPHNGAYTTMTSCGTAGSGALVGVTDPGFAPAWNGTTSSVSATGFTSAVSGAFSVEAWVFPTSMTADMAVIGTRNNGFSFDLQLCVDATYCNSTQNIRVALGDGTKWLSTANTPYAWQLNRWTHIVAAIDSTAGAYSVFVNGSLVGRNLFTTAGTGVLVDSTHNLYIGQEGYGAGWFAGRIDEVAVYPFALDGDQVMTHYQAGRALAFRDAETFYDALGNVTQTDDNTYLANPAFESGTFGWQGTASAYFASAGDANLHQPTNDFGSLNVTGTAKATQTVTLAPGQTVRFQLWDKTGTGAHGSVLFKYWRLSTPGWVDLVTGINPSDASWTSHAWDAVIPMDSDGRVQVTLWNDTGTGTTYFDDLALLTSWGSMSYTVGVPTLPLSTCTLQPNQSASATLCVRTGYGTETSPYAVPAIFPKTVTADYVDGTYSAASPDEDLITTTTFDAWGRATKTTDPDGVSSTTDYSATNHSDIDDTKDGLGKVTSYAYDAVGDRISVDPPLHEKTTTTYDLLDHPLIETAPDGTKAANVYNNQGQRTNSIANYVDGSPSGASGTDDLTTTYLYDAFGQVTSTIADDGTGLIKAKTSQTYDLLGNVTSTTVYGDTAYSDARTTTAYFDTVTGTTPLVSRPKPTGSAGPILPGGTVPACPGTTSTPCNAVTTLDAAGRAVISTDAYNVATRTYLDLAGRPVQVIANFVDGAYSPSAKDTDLATTMSYDILGKPTLVSDVLSHRTTTAYDKMERPIEVQQLDTAGAGVNSVKTAYTPGGRTDRVARPAAVGAADSARTWTKTVYDLAGRAIATLGHYDPTGTAQIAFDPLEGPLSDRWAAGGDALYNAPASTGMDDAYSAQGPRSGTGRLRVTTNTSTTNEGVRFDLNTGSAGILLGTVNLAPPSFVNQHTYTLHADVFATGAGNSVAAILGSATVHGSVASVTPNGVWMPIEATWTVPSGPNVTTGVEAVIRLGNGSATATSFYIDNVWVWDSSSAGFNPNGTDQNIPSLSVFDDDGRPVESILPPHALPTIAAPSQPLVTATAYDLLGRPASVSVNATASYPSTVASDTDVGYWPLDERAGTTIHDKASTADLTLAGGAVLAAASALDEARTGIDFDGSSGVASRTSAVSSLTNNFTFEAWFRADGLPSAGNYSVVAYNGTETAGWGIGLDSTGALVARYGSVNWLATTAIVKTGTYHHAALVRNAGTATLYLDGTAYAPTNATSTPGAPGASFSIGREDATAGRYFNGVVDDVAVYGTALSSTRIAAHATAGRNTAADTNLTSRTAYDALGRAVDGYDPRMIRTHEEYDRLGRVTATTLDYIDGTASGATNDDDVRSRYAYDAIGELTAFCTANAVFGADACDPTSTSTGSAAYQSGWHYTYDKAGHVASQVAPVNTQLAVGLAAKFWTYDAGGRLTTQCDVAAGGTCGSPLRHTDMTFDGIGRTMTVKTYLGAGTSGNLKLSWTKTYDADSTLTKVDFDGTGSSESTDATNLVYDTAGRLSQVKDAALNVVTSYAAYNPDGTVWKRTDLGQTQAAFTYDYAGRLASSTYPSVFSGTISDTYGPDGLLTKRTWPTNGETATLTYDGAKRPTQVSYSALSSNLSETYDRDGNVTGEGRSLTNVSTTSGDAGGHTQSFVYDKLNRVSSASGLTAGSSTYTYDLDSNRTAVTALGVATTFAYDRTDELVKETISGTNTSFVYDAYGNLTKSATSSSTQTTNAYDLGDRLTSITPASGSSATFTLDALGRFKTRLVSGSTTETYSYLGTSETAWKIAGPTVTTCALDAAGSRTAENVGGTVGFLVFDVHGDVAAAETAAQTAYAAAIRYDPYGQTADTYKSGTGGIDLAWKFQGRLDIAPSGAPLYDAGARFYAPYLGQFTQLDSVTGRPTDPRSMNRFLYAEGNPWTFVDPSGHMIGCASASSDLCNETTAVKYKHTPAGKKAAKTISTHDHSFVSQGTPYQCSSSVCNAYAPAMPVETSWVAPTYSEWMASGRDDTQVEAYLDAYGAQAYIDLLTGNYSAKNAGTVQFLAREYLILLARRTNNESLLASIPTNPLFASPLAAGTEDFATQVAMDPLDFGYLAIGLWGGIRSAKGSGSAFQPVQGSIEGATPTRSQVSTLISDTAQQVSDLGTDYLDSKMSPEQRAASDAQPWLKPLYRGTIVHNETAERLRGVFGSDNSSYSTKGPDFTIFGQDYELTTVGGQSAHENKYRDQYPDLMYPTYNLPGT